MTFYGPLKSAHRKAGFTLMEMAMVLLVLSLLAGAATRYIFANNDSNNIAAANATLDVIETALMNYRNMNSRLPCPAVMNPTGENSAAFGAEVETLGDGLCTGIAATPGTTGWINSGTDPYASDSNYIGYYGGTAATLASANANVVNQVVAGALPTKALKIADKYAYDPWGRMILYVVDIRYTASNAFTTYTLSTANNSGAPGVIVITGIPTNATEATPNPLAQVIAYRGIYALVSFGENGHGGYVRNLSSTPVFYNAGSTNTDELQNCHCTTSAGTTIDREFVQNPKNNAEGGTMFDDIVRFKTRVDMASSSELQ